MGFEQYIKAGGILSQKRVWIEYKEVEEKQRKIFWILCKLERNFIQQLVNK